jgi:hypothetical protein
MATNSPGFWEQLGEGLAGQGSFGTGQRSYGKSLQGQSEEEAAFQKQQQAITAEEEKKARAEAAKRQAALDLSERQKAASEALSKAVQAGLDPAEVRFEHRGRILKASEFAPSGEVPKKKPPEQKKEVPPAKAAEESTARPAFSVEMTKGRGGADVPLYTLTGNVPDEQMDQALREFRAQTEIGPGFPESRGGFMQSNPSLSVGSKGEIVNPEGGWVPESVTAESQRRQEQLARERLTADPYGTEAIRAQLGVQREERERGSAEWDAAAKAKHAEVMQVIKGMKDPQERAASQALADKALQEALQYSMAYRLLGNLGVKPKPPAIGEGDGLS